MREETIEQANVILEKIATLKRRMDFWNGEIQANEDWNIDTKTQLVDISSSHYQTKIDSLEAEFEAL